MAAYPELRIALWHWVKFVTATLLRESPKYLKARTWPGWIINGDGHYVANAESWYWDIYDVPDIFSCKEWLSVNEASEAIPELISQLDTLVGTHLIGLRQLNLQDLARSLVPKPVLSPDHQTVKVEPKSEFNRRYRALEAFLHSSTIQCTFMWYLESLELDQVAVDLEPGVSIRRLKPNEITNFLRQGLIRPSPYMTYYEPPGHVYGLVVEKQYPKIIGELPDDPESFKAMHNELLAIEEDVPSILNLVGAKGIRILGRLGTTLEMFGVGFAFHGGTVMPLEWLPHLANLDKNGCYRLKKSFKAFRHLHRQSALHLAITRLWVATTRWRREDQLIDLMIAAEALYLGSDNAGTRGELRYRMRLNAAIWSNNAVLGMTKKEVVQVMNRAYDTRSVLVHGGKIGKRLQLNGAQVEIYELIAKAEKIIHEGALKALRAAKGAPSWTVEWDSLILPGP